MSLQIKTINLVTKTAMLDRDVNLYGKHVQSVNIYQTDGSFVTTEPFNNKLIWYPQNPNNIANTILGEWKVFTSFTGYGSLSIPMDARFDYARRILWIADAGNKRVLKVDINSGTALDSVTNGYFSNSVVININDGSVYVKSIKNSTTGIIQHYNQNADLQRTFEFSCTYSVTEENIVQKSYALISSLPLPSSMVFDHVRRRLWWVGESTIYMMDTLNKNIVPYSLLTNGFSSIISIDVDFESGNTFAIGKKTGYDSWFILQIFRDNNQLVSTAYIEKIIL